MDISAQPSGKSEEHAELRFLEGVAKRLPDDAATLHALAELYTRTGRYEEGLKIDLQLSGLFPEDPVVWYNLGCSQALLCLKDDAMASLARSVELGYDDYDGMKSDSDLAHLNSDPRFESLLSWLYTVYRADDARLSE